MPQDIQTILNTVHDTIKAQPFEGRLYSEALAHDIDQHALAVAIVTTDGTTYQAGDANVMFALQSMSKVFTYGLALEDRGRDGVRERVGVEPTGRRYNAILLEETTGRPYNPMVNAGAIAIADMIAGNTITERLNRSLHRTSDYVGRHLQLDAETLTYELQNGDLNRAIAYLMRSSGTLLGSVEDALHLYFQHCSLLVNTVELATMAATLANSGTHPTTGRQALSREYVADVLSVMYTCGMYDRSGLWAYTVGLPAKSGVSGGVFAVLPGKMGIAAYSPLLDEVGHSVKGVRVFEALSEALRLNIFSSNAPDERPTVDARTAPSPDA